MQSVRVRIVRPHLIYDGSSWPTSGVGNYAFVTQDYDPIQQAQTPDTACNLAGGAPDYPIQVNSVTPFTQGHQVTADFLDPSGTPPTICLISGKILYLTKSPSFYINQKTFNSGPGDNNTIALLQAVGVGVHVDVFNPSYQGVDASDGPLLDQAGNVCPTGTPTFCDTMYQTALMVLFQQVAATGTQAYLATQGNEENGGVAVQCGTGPSAGPSTNLLQIGTNNTNGLGALQAACTASSSPQTLTMNGDWGDLLLNGPNLTMVHQIQKMRDLCIVAHSVGAKCADGGIETNGLEGAYLDYLWNYCTAPSQLACRQKADIFQQWGYNKSAGQAYNFSANLVTSCQYPSGGPAYLSNHALIVAQRSEALLAEAANAGSPQDVDYWNFHWYDVPGQGMAPAVAYYTSLTGKPPMADEAGIYTHSWVDMVRFLQQAKLMGIQDLEWWNQGGGGGDASLSGAYSCTSGCTVAGVQILPDTGAVWNAFFTGQIVQVLNGFPPPQPFC